MGLDRDWANVQSTQELEELLSERLQQLPQPLARGGSGGSPATAGREDDVFSFEGEQEQPRDSRRPVQQVDQASSQADHLAGMLHPGRQSWQIGGSLTRLPTWCWSSCCEGIVDGEDGS